MEGQSSTPLSARGALQAQQLRDALSAHTNARTAAPFIYSSPLLRATQTTDILREAIDCSQYQCASDLQEIHQGIFQGLTWTQVQTHYPQLCQQLLNARQWQPVPQAESPAAARQRAAAWINHILTQHQPGETIWAVSHGGIMQQLVAVILGCDRTWQIPVHHTARFEFWLTQTHWQSLTTDRFNPEYWILRRFNDISHLDLRSPAPAQHSEPLMH